MPKGVARRAVVDALRAGRHGRIVAVGRLAEVMKTRGPATRVIDLGGRTSRPDFVDAHGHVTMGGFQALSINLQAPPDDEVRDIASLQKTLRHWIAVDADAAKKANLVAGFG